jgi:hypothetical protein
MAKEIELPDGSIGEFPDDMSDDAIRGVLRQKFGSPQQQPAPQQPSLKQTMREQSAANPWDAFNTGIANASSRVAHGIGQLLPQESPLRRILPSQQDINLLEAGTEGNAYARTGQVAMDITASAPAALKLFKAVNAARGLAPAIAAETGLNAGYGALTADAGKGAEGASVGTGATLVGHALGPAMRGIGNAAAHTLGLTTGAGSESIKQAFKGGDELVANMRGQVAPATVVDAARQGVHNMRQQMYARYATAKGGWANDTTPLDLKPIAQLFDDTTKKFSFQGVPQPGVIEVQQKVGEALGHWKTQAGQNPAFYTVEGLDALKRHLQDLMPDYSNRAGRAFVTEVVNGVKATIRKQAPKYKEAMDDYWRSTEELDEITKSLSLGDKATIDTALRKLQSLARNNANTNYGQRAVLAKALAEQGGQDVMPAIAGQALNSWTPRGLQGAIAGGAGLPSAILAPKALLAAPAMSPRAVGEATRALGLGVNDPRTQAILNVLRRGSAPAMSSLSRPEDE